jgi:hypothetical protein
LIVAIDRELFRCDGVLQIFIGRDITCKKSFICLLYTDDPVKYTCSEVSEEALNQFLHGKIDLRDMYTKHALKLYLANENMELEDLEELKEYMLPSPGYYL